MEFALIRPINRCLNSQLLEICQQAIKLDELNGKIKAILASPLNTHCSAAAFNSGCLLITVTNSAWATELRYQLPELRDKLRKTGLYQLRSIKIALAEFDPKQLEQDVTTKRLLSSSARTTIQNASKYCSYQPLRDALLHLAADT